MLLLISKILRRLSLPPLNSNTSYVAINLDMFWQKAAECTHSNTSYVAINLVKNTAQQISLQHSNTSYVAINLIRKSNC